MNGKCWAKTSISNCSFGSIVKFVVAAPAQWPSERRELSLDGKALRLSDHAPVEARFAKDDPPVLAN